MIVKVTLRGDGFAAIRLSTSIGGRRLLAESVIMPDHMVQKRFLTGEREAFFEATMSMGLLHIGERRERPKDWRDE